MSHRARFASALAAFVILASIPPANAQVTGWVSDDFVVTVGTGGRGGFVAGYCTTAVAVCPANYGAVSISTLPAGLSIATLTDQPPPAKAGDAYLRTQLAISGFSTNPGQGWVSRLDCSGMTYPGAAANYTFSGGRATWSWPKPDGFLPAFQGRTSVNCSINRPGVSGWVRPKFKVVGVTYAPPGSSSNATYSNAFRNGTSTSHASNFTTSASYSVSYTTGGGLFGLIGGSATTNISAGWSQSRDSNSSLSVTSENANGLVVPGPASSAAGVDHDFDTIYVWLNPAVFTMIFPNSVAIGGFAYDARDTVQGMDVIPLTVGQLKGIHPITGPTQARLNRTWDPVLGGLTTADYQVILQANPFAHNPSYNPNTDPTRRFELPMTGNPAQPSNLIFNYVPAPPGAQPTAQTYNSSYNHTTEVGQSARDSYTTSYSVDHTASGEFLVSLSVKLSNSSTWSSSNQWSRTVTNSATQSAGFTIVPPRATDNYVGPTAIQVWKDNVYGTFMFFPQN